MAKKQEQEPEQGRGNAPDHKDAGQAYADLHNDALEQQEQAEEEAAKE